MYYVVYFLCLICVSKVALDICFQTSSYSSVSWLYHINLNNFYGRYEDYRYDKFLLKKTCALKFPHILKLYLA